MHNPVHTLLNTPPILPRSPLFSPSLSALVAQFPAPPRPTTQVFSLASLRVCSRTSSAKLNGSSSARGRTFPAPPRPAKTRCEDVLDLVEVLPRLKVLEPEEDLESVEPFEEAVEDRVRDGVMEGLYMFPAPPRPAGV